MASLFGEVRVDAWTNSEVGQAFMTNHAARMRTIAPGLGNIAA